MASKTKDETSVVETGRKRAFKAIGKVTQEDWDSIIQRAIEGAVKGNRYDRQWLTDMHALTDSGGAASDTVVFKFVPAKDPDQAAG